MSPLKQPSRRFSLGWLLRNRQLQVTVGLLVLYRLLTNIPLPGVDPFIVEEVRFDPGSPDLVTGLLHLLSGGAFGRLSVLALGIVPALSASGIVRASIPIVPGLRQRVKEDPRGVQPRLDLWKYILIAPVSVLQAFALFFAVQPGCSLNLYPRITFHPGLLSTITVFLMVTAGAYLAMWIAELINVFGLRDLGVNAIVFSGASLVLSEEIYKFWQGPQAGTPAPGAHWLEVGIYGLGLLAGLIVMAYFAEGRRNIPIVYPPKGQLFYALSPGARMARQRPGASLPIPMRSAWDGIVDSQAVLLMLFMISLYLACSAQGAWQRAGVWVIAALQPASPWSGPLLFLSIVFFGPLIATVRFSEEDYAENLRRTGAQISGIKGKEATQKYLDSVHLRISLGAAVIAGFVFLIPWIVNLLFGLDTLLLAGEALFLLVVFTRDAFSYLEAEAIVHGYSESLLVR